MSRHPLAKHCPFCGSEEVDEYTKETGNYKDRNRVLIVCMKCFACGASSKAFAYIENEEDDFSYWKAFGNAIDAWNRRSVKM